MRHCEKVSEVPRCWYCCDLDLDRRLLFPAFGVSPRRLLRISIGGCGYTSLSLLTARYGPLFFAFRRHSSWHDPDGGCASIRPSRRHTNVSSGASGPRSLLDSSIAPSSCLGVTQPSTGHDCPKYTFPTIRFEFLLQTCGPSACSLLLYYCSMLSTIHLLPAHATLVT